MKSKFGGTKVVGSWGVGDVGDGVLERSSVGV
jgi:hypothetical protein